MSPKKILICDDEEGVREALKVVLSDHYPLVLVESADAAMEALAKTKDIGLAFIDIKMPKTGGFEILPKIKKDHPHVKVIIITGYRSAEIAADATELGAVGYMPKPFKSEELLEAVKKHLK